jgi:hypothetical protein
MKETKNNSEIQFSLQYSALKMFGRELYSNPISAISELVANACDAGAKNIHLLIDMRKKDNSGILIIDNGIGMNEEDLKNNYAMIGWDKRRDEKYKNKKNIKGRKGIGKLAALYLSDMYYLSLRQQGADISTWSVNIAKQDLDNKPSLIKQSENDHKFVENSIFDDYVKKFETFESGTMIYIPKSDLRGIGPERIQKLKYEMGDYFTIKELNNNILKLTVFDEDETPKIDETINKEFKLDNLVSVVYSEDYKEYFDHFIKEKIKVKNPTIRSKEIEVVDESLYDKNEEDFEFDRKQPMMFGEVIKNNQLMWGSENIEIKGNLNAGKKENIKVNVDDLKISGFVAVANALGLAETKNSSIKPGKLSLYLNGKKAKENLLDDIKSTQVFAKYVTGEISFDILDDDQYDDATTTNRQDVNEFDERYQFLIKYLMEIVNKMIRDRSDFAKDVSKVEKKACIKKNKKIKKNYMSEIRKFNTTDEIVAYTNKNMKGDYIKDNPKIFLSHSSEDKNITNFIENILLKIGIKDEEYFYTSSQLNVTGNSNIFDEMRDVLISDKTFVYYYLTKSFLEKKVTMMEAGAAWLLKWENNDYAIASSDLDKHKSLLSDVMSFQDFVLKIDKTFFQSDFSIDKYINIAKNINLISKFVNENRINANKKMTIFDCDIKKDGNFEKNDGYILLKQEFDEVRKKIELDSND